MNEGFPLRYALSSLNFHALARVALSLFNMTLIHTVEDVTLQFLSEAIGSKIVNYSAERIGTGQVGECHRIQLEYADGAEGPSSVILKIAASGHLSRSAGWSIGTYERESRFYSEIAPKLDSPYLAKCYHTSVDRKEDAFHVLLEDLQPAATGNDLVGAALERARVVVKGLGELQKAALNMTLPDWVERELPYHQAGTQQLWSMFLDRYKDRVSSVGREVGERYVGCFDKLMEELNNGGPEVIKGLTHVDYRLDNMLFDHNQERPLCIVDWQTFSIGPLFRDIAYFLGVGLTKEVRREHGQELLREYYNAFGPEPPFSFEQCQEGVRRQCLLGLPLAYASPILLERTERGDEMFLTMLDRLATQALDLNTLETLPKPAPPAPLSVEPQNETSHPPGTDPWHNESWYFDVADIEQGVGVWVRLGVTPNQASSWYNALVCGPGRPTIAVVDFETPHPGSDLVINTDKVKATHNIEVPLEHYRVTLIGRGESFDDPGDLLRGKRGKPVALHIDLTWSTAGTPYQWRSTTRYEIPCTVSGTIVVDKDVTTFTNAPGQRDHSWGSRDWWTVDWVWSAFHLDDGTHTHAVQARLPTGFRSGVGYIQGKDLPIAELSNVEVTEEVGPDSLIRNSKMTISSEAAGKVVFNIKTLGHGPVRLVDPTGRLSFFPRHWAEIQTEDGRKGVGWIEWNFVKRRHGETEEK